MQTIVAFISEKKRRSSIQIKVILGFNLIINEKADGKGDQAVIIKECISCKEIDNLYQMD